MSYKPDSTTPSRNHLHHISQHGRPLASFPGPREGLGNEARQTTYNITDTSTGHLAMISYTLAQATCGITHASRDHYHTHQHRFTTVLYPRADCVQHGVHGTVRALPKPLSLACEAETNLHAVPRRGIWLALPPHVLHGKVHTRL